MYLRLHFYPIPIPNFQFPAAKHSDHSYIGCITELAMIVSNVSVKFDVIFLNYTLVLTMEGTKLLLIK
jgi:hypothetical protein